MRSHTIPLLLAIYCVLTGGAQAESYTATQGKMYKFQEVAKGVYYASGGIGSNNVVIVNDDDVLIVDNGTTPAAARAFLADLRLLTAKPVRTVVNTHFHYDHTNGNQIFGPEVAIIAHEYVRRMIGDPAIFQREPYVTSMTVRLPNTIRTLQQRVAGEADPPGKRALLRDLSLAEANRDGLKELRAAPPNVTYDSKLVLHKGAREIQLLFLGRGHTAGDTFVYLPQEGIICTGDENEGSRLAYMGDAIFDEWIETLDKLKQLDFRLALPGHGVPFGDKRIITAFQDYIRDIVRKGYQLRKQGVSAADAATKIDMSAHAKNFPEIHGPGVEARGVRRLYEWLEQQEKAGSQRKRQANELHNRTGNSPVKSTL